MSQYGINRVFKENGVTYRVTPMVETAAFVRAEPGDQVSAVLVVDRRPIEGPAECQAALAYVGRTYGDWLDDATEGDRLRYVAELERAAYDAGAEDAIEILRRAHNSHEG